MRILFSLILSGCSFLALAQTQQFVLDNGLKLIVKEDHRAPVLISMIWYDAGSADEKAGTTGVAHALEHLMFKGTPKYPLGVFSKTIAGIGGQFNAFTSDDYTAYFEKISANQLETSFKLEADRMKNLILEPEEFKKEIKVIQEERRMRTDDSPQSLAFERFLATAHLTFPYQHPVIGWMTDLQQMTNEDAKQWYLRFYEPNHATIVVVGDVDPQKVYALAKKYFAKIPSGSSLTRKDIIEPPRLGKKTVKIHAEAQVPMLMMGYTVPSVKAATDKNSIDPYALEILASILGASDSGRLTEQLIRKKQIASNIEGYYDLYKRYQTQFIIYGSPSQGYSLAQLGQAILGEVQKLKTERISDAELQRVKTQIIAQKTFERDSIQVQAMEIGLLETIGLGWQTSEKYIERIKSITPEQLQQAAQTYFNEDNLTQAYLIPTKQGKP